MAMNVNYKLEELERNIKLKTALETADTSEKAYEILVSHNVDVTLEEVREMLRNEQDELLVDDLDEVAGGCRHPHHEPYRRRFVGYKVVIVSFFPLRIVRVPIYR